MVKQNIVFVENTPGSLQKVTKILAENQIDIYGFGCFDAPEFANFRMVCDDPEKADQIMAENGNKKELISMAPARGLAEWPKK